MCLASTSVTMPSTRANALISGSTRKVCATGAGSAMPVVSMTMPSSLRSPAATRWASFFRILTRSDRTVQHTQPFSTSTISSSEANLLFFCTSASSIDVSPNSFSMIAIFLPWVAVRMWFNSVVFPDPRKPVSTVAGTRGSESSSAGGDACGCRTLPFVLAISQKKHAREVLFLAELRRWRSLRPASPKGARRQSPCHATAHVASGRRYDTAVNLFS